MHHRSGRVRAASFLSVPGPCAARYRAGWVVRSSVLLLLLLVAGAVFVAPALAAGSMGGVIRDEFVVPIDSARVDLWRSPDGVSPYVWLGMDLSDVVGAYSVPTPGSGWYKVQFSDPLGRYASEWWANKIAAGIDEADAVWLSEDQNANFVNAVLQSAGRAAGIVTGAGGAPVEGIRIDVFRWSDAQQDWVGTRECYSGPGGAWEATGLTPGQFRFHFRDTRTTPVYADQFWDRQPFWTSAHPVSIWPGANADFIDAELEVGAFVGGVVRDEGGLPLAGVEVTAFGQDNSGGWPGVRFATTNAFGQYTLGPLAAGDYRVWFDGASTWVSEYWDDKRWDWEADTVPLVPGQNFVCDATLAASGGIAGHVEADDSHSPLEGIEVSVAYWAGWDFGGWQDSGPLATTDAGGDYIITGLAPGAYRVGFRDPDADWATEWYDDTLYDWATDVPVSGAQTTPVDASLAPAGHIAGVVRDTEGNPIPGSMSPPAASWAMTSKNNGAGAGARRPTRPGSSHWTALRQADIRSSCATRTASTRSRSTRTRSTPARASTSTSPPAARSGPTRCSNVVEASTVRWSTRTATR